MNPKVKGLPQLNTEQKTPKHDELQIKLLDKELLLKYITNDPIIKIKIDRIISSANRKFNPDTYSYATPYEDKYLSHSIELSNPTLEYVVKSNNGFISGYIDVVLQVQLLVNIRRIEKEEKQKFTRKEVFTLGIEIKPTISTMGEILRQLQTYKSLTGFHIVIFTPEIKYKTIFEGQGFSYWGESE